MGINTSARVSCELCESLAPRWATTTFVVRAPDGTERFLCFRCLRKLRRIFPGLVEQALAPLDAPKRIVEI